MSRKFKFNIFSALFICFVFIILCMGVNTFVIASEYDAFYTKFHQSYRQLAQIVDFQNDVETLYGYVALVPDANLGERDALMYSYETAYETLVKKISKLRDELEGRAYYYCVDILNMLKTMDENTQDFDTLRKNENNYAVYLRSEVRAIGRVKGFITSELNALGNLRIKEAQKQYSEFEDHLTDMKNNSLLVTLPIAAVCLFFAYMLSRGISLPLENLVHRMEHFVGTGEDIPGKTTKIIAEEVRSLVCGYNEMIGEITVKTELERQLINQQMDNLTMQSLLTDAQISMLRMQINPHFLFNTLNSIKALAQIEIAPKTGEMIDNLASMLRYTINESQQLVPLKSELDIVKNYIDIYKMRYGNKIEFILDIEETDIMLPCMLIQPIIENSIVHGLEHMEKQGIVLLNVFCKDTFLHIEVQDNGEGIPAEKLHELLSGTKAGNQGIGLTNVIKRMELIYGKNLIDIQSGVNCGTTVSIKIPIEEESTHEQLI